MYEFGLILDSIMLPEAGLALAMFLLFIFLWIILRRIKGLKRTLATLEWGHLTFYYQSSENRSWRWKLINTDRNNMKDLQACSSEVLHFFDRIGFLTQQRILSEKEIYQTFGLPILGYFSFLGPYIQWLRTEERDPELHLYFEELNESFFRFNRKRDRKRTHPLLEEEELNLFIEEEKAALQGIISMEPKI